MGWKPGAGFLNYGWEGYSEAMLLYLLGLGSPTHPLPAASYDAWTTTYQWENLYDLDFLFAAPLFIHQLSHLWIDFRGIQDPFMREKRSDYFENSRRATLVQQQYAVRNPKWFEGYGENCWGITAGPGPGFCKQRAAGGIERQFYGYVARGVPFGPDDGTLAPWAAVASLPFAPEIVLAALDTSGTPIRRSSARTGCSPASTPPSTPGDGAHRGWLCGEHLGLDQGPVVLMIENYRSGLLWSLMRDCPAIVTGLRRAGFRADGCERATMNEPDRTESRAALLPDDPYDVELLAHVRPAGWKNPHARPPLQPGGPRRRHRRAGGRDRRRRPRRQGGAGGEEPARRRLPQRRLRSLQGAPALGAVLRRPPPRAGFTGGAPPPSDSGLHRRHGAHAPAARPPQPPRLGPAAPGPGRRRVPRRRPRSSTAAGSRSAAPCSRSTRPSSPPAPAPRGRTSTASRPPATSPTRRSST